MELRRGRQVVLVAASATVKGGLVMDLLMAIGILRHVWMRASTVATARTATGTRAERRQRTVIAVVAGTVSRYGRCRCGRCSRRIQRIQLGWQINRNRNGNLQVKLILTL